MNSIMAKNVPNKVAINPGECTEFQLHKSQLTIFQGILHKIHDYTEHRLIRNINHARDEQQRLMLVALLHDYIEGEAAVAWKRGKPIWIRVTKD